MYFNCQGFLKNKDEILLLIITVKPLIVCLTETHVTPEHLEYEYSIEGYRMEICHTNNSRTGGILIFISEVISYAKVNNLQLENYLWLLSLKLNIQSKYILTVVYHPPNKEDSKFMKFFEEYMDQLGESVEDQVIVGDFNYNLLNSTYYSERMKHIIMKSGYKQLVKEPTRITPLSATLIDYVITNSNNINYKLHITPKISDHSIISVYLHSCLPSSNFINLKIRSHRHFNAGEFQQKLSNVPWSNSTANVNELADNLISSIEYTFNEMCPLVEVRVPQKHVNNKWMTAEILRFMKERDNKYKIATQTNIPQDWENYKRARNLVVKNIKMAKNNYYINMIDNNRQNSHEMWKHLKRLLPNNKSNNKNIGVEFDDKKVLNDKEIAENFNRFFINSINNIVESVTPINDQNLILNKINTTNELLTKFQLVSMCDVRKIIMNLKNTGGCEDGLSTKVIKCAFEVLGNRFVDVINSSLCKGIFPENWKTSLVIPVPKITNTVKCVNFRPINVVPVYEKILEVTVKNQLVKFCDQHNVIASNQSGFRRGHSCETVIMNVCDTWLRAIDFNNVILAVFLDFKRAFETIDRNLLLKKLEKIGIRDSALSWFKSYLTDRYQKVKYNNSMSHKIKTLHGVPQGTVLGPILFNIFLNDIVQSIKYSDMVMFVDDTMFYVTGNNIEDMLYKINCDIELIFNWLCDNKLCVNLGKSKCILFGSKRKISTIDQEHLAVFMNNTKMEFVTEIKYLGIKLDQNLNFQKNALYVMYKMSQKTYFLNRIGKHLSMQTKLLLYKSLISPHIDYCSTLLFNLPAFRVQELQCIQNRCMRNILSCNRYTPIYLMLQILNLMSVKNRVMYNTMIFLYKTKNRLLPGYLFNKLVFASDIHTYNTRGANNFNVNISRTSQMQQAVFAGGLVRFNALPADVKNAVSIKTFKRLLFRYIFEHF